MGVDTRITLPVKTRVTDVMEVIAAIVGFPKRLELIGHKDSKAFHCDGVKFNATSVPSMINLSWDGPIDGEHSVYYHFESETGRPLLAPRATPFWLAVGVKLVETFGGEIDYSDCDRSDVDFSKRKPSFMGADDGHPWQRWQEWMFSVTPITPADVKNAAKRLKGIGYASQEVNFPEYVNGARAQ